MKQPLFLLAIISSFISCQPATIDDSRLVSLYRQRIPNTKYVIYEFDISGYMAFDASNLGLTLYDSTKAFSEDNIDQLPGLYFIGNPTISSLKMLDMRFNYRTEKDTLLTPVKKYSTKFSGVPVDIAEYNDTYGSATTSTGLMEYQFDGFKETDDSLIFYNVIKIFGGKNFASTTSFVKGNIKIVDSTQGDIVYIELNEAVIKRGDIYKPKSRELTHNRTIVGIATYWFYPKTKSKSSAFSDYGIYKRIK